MIEGAVSLEDMIKDAYKQYSEMKIQLGKDKENLDLQYKTDYLWTRYQKMKATLEAAKVAEREADPAAAKAAEDARNRAAREAEKAAALPAEEKLALLQELAIAMEGEDADVAVPELLRREGKAVEKAVAAYKEALRNTKATNVEKITADSLAKKAQKRYLALKEQVKMEEDKKAAALALAKEKAQELEDTRNAIKLTPAETLEIVKKVGELTKVELTGDEAVDNAAKAAALEVALEYKKTVKKAMNRLKKAAKKLKEELGEEVPEFAEANAKYYKQKAVFEQVKKILAKTDEASQQAAAASDKARFGGELAGWIKDELSAQIAGFKEWAASGDAAEDFKAGQVLLAKLEDDAQFAVATAKRKMEKKGSDKNKQKYYDALARYEFLSKELGENSPAKLAEKARKVKAAAEAALQELAESLQRAKSLKDVVKFIEKASKGTSPLP